MDWIWVIILAVVQGVTEFLPISSTAHLVIGGHLLEHFFGIEIASDSVRLIVVLHAGSLLAIIVYYRRTLIDLVRRPEQRRMIPLIILATIPIALIGGFFMGPLEGYFSNLWVSAAGLCLTAVMLLAVHDSRTDGDRTELSRITWRQAVAVGLIQAIAILPGISRSGSTISLATRAGIRADAAASFSFLLALPALIGAVIIKMPDIINTQPGPAGGDPIPFDMLAVGLLVSAIVSYGALSLLIGILKKGKFSIFGYYCLGVAALIAIVQVTGT